MCIVMKSRRLSFLTFSCVGRLTAEWKNLSFFWYSFSGNGERPAATRFTLYICQLDRQCSRRFPISTLQVMQVRMNVSLHNKNLVLWSIFSTITTMCYWLFKLYHNSGMQNIKTLIHHKETETQATTTQHLHQGPKVKQAKTAPNAGFGLK